VSTLFVVVPRGVEVRVVHPGDALCASRTDAIVLDETIYQTESDAERAMTLDWVHTALYTCLRPNGRISHMVAHGPPRANPNYLLADE
jgi:hypothetical protein